MSIVVRENPQLIFDAWTVSRSPALYHAGEERRLVEAGLQDFMDLFISMKNVAVLLLRPVLDTGRLIKIREPVRIKVTSLDLKFGRIDRSNVNPGRSTGLHPSGGNAEGNKLLGQTG